jgi:molybdopterin/thiamine biosynthesis adenylyltransferase
MLRKRKSSIDIAGKKVTIIGVGGIGANMALLLTQAGVRKLRLVDFDRVEACNLNRGQVFTYKDIGKYKVEVAARNVEKVNSSAEIDPIVKEMGSYDDIAAVIDDADFVVRAADKPVPYFNEWFNSACINLEKPFITGGMNEYLGVYGPLCIPRRTACLECCGSIHVGEARQFLNANSVFSPSWGPLMGFIGDLMGNDIIAFLKGRITSISHNQFIIDASTMTFTPRKIQRNPQCGSCGSE